MSVSYTYRELQDIFLKLTALLRDIDLNTDSKGLVRLAYQLNSAPFQELGQGVTYVWVNYADTEVNNQINEEYKTLENDILKINRSQTRQIDVHYTFYGDENIQDIAYEFRNKLFSYKAKEFLDKYDIKLILNVPEAILNYEQVRNQWWSRVDFVVSYYLESKLVEELEVFTSTNVSVVTEKESLNKSFSVMTDNN